jgi:quinolinate synthase
MHVWPGECHVHAGIRPADLDRARAEHGDADLLVHPECGCASQCMYFKASGDIEADRTHILSTEGMVKHAQQYPTRSFVVATELGIMHRLAKEAPQGRFYAASERAICRYMKKITLEKLLISLRDDVFEVKVPEDVADRARGAIQRMVEL